VAKKVLIVDDSLTVRQQVLLALRPGGFDVIEAFDGIDGLSTFEHAPDTAMIICDVNMPRMDGLDMVEAIQKRGLKVPIVMLTTEGQPRLIARAKKAGVKGWIVKPFKPELLLAAVQRLIGPPC
jgi:two-component system, chemotaxis family, chemotaxis protein CheY